MDGYPNLRAYTKKGRNGQSWTSYWYDMRSKGQKDIPLGNDLESAIARWERIRAGENVRPASLKNRRRKVPALKRGARRRIEHPTWAELPQKLRTLYLNCERRSAESGRMFALSIEDFIGLVGAANGRCALTGIPFSMEGGSGNPFAPSMDRIDSTKGYILGNVRLVCWIVNAALNQWGEAPLVDMAEGLLRVRSRKHDESDA